MRLNDVQVDMNVDTAGGVVINGRTQVTLALQFDVPGAVPQDLLDAMEAYHEAVDERQLLKITKEMLNILQREVAKVERSIRIPMDQRVRLATRAVWGTVTSERMGNRGYEYGVLWDPGPNALDDNRTWLASQLIDDDGEPCYTGRRAIDLG